MAVIEEFPDDKELQDATKSIKNLLKKRWKDIYNKSKQDTTKETPTKASTPTQVYKLPYLKDGKASLTTMDD